MNTKIILSSLILASLTTQLMGCAAAVVPVAATGMAVANDRRTTGTIIDDKSIEVKAMHALSHTPEIWRQCHITAVSYNNIVVLVGQAPTEALKQQAESIISEIPKIQRIHNELCVEAPNSLAQRSKDAWITTQIKGKMLGSKTVKVSRIKVITENNVVYLMGLVTPAEEKSATDIAREIPDVEKIIQIFEYISAN
jgi:osmotically-inducible protein OsmY